MPEGVTLRVVRTTTELEEMEAEWRALWLSDPQATPFQSPEWLLPWWRQFGQPELRAVAISVAGELVGLLPFYIYREPCAGARQLLLMGAGTSDYLDGVFGPECRTEHVRQGLELLRRDDDWDEALLVQLRRGSKLQQAVAGCGALFAGDACSRMRAARVADLPRKLRQNIAYYRRRARGLGALTFEVAEESNCLELFDALAGMHEERWHERGEAGVLSDARVVAWHREAIPLLARAGLLHLSALRLDGEMIAALYGLVDAPGRRERALYVYIPAFAVRHAGVSPGTLLLAEVMEHAAEAGIQTIDLLRGEEGYKRLWHAERVTTVGYALRPKVGRLVEAA